MNPIEDLVAALTTEEKVRLLGGRDFWHTEPVERLGIPTMHLSDGPVGVRGARTVGTTSVSWPCATAIGATFDPGAASELADALADECLDKGVHMLLGPTINIQRHPLGGRHFECYSEDPWLTADLAVAYVRALQRRGIAATVKHFVANDTEFERHTISSDVDEEVLRRLYLLPFEQAVVHAGPWALMSAYNKINGTYAAEHPWLLGETLRAAWGFDGLVVSDWFGAQSTAPSANAGLDLEMPGPPVHYGAALHAAIEAGEVRPEVLDERVRRVLQLAERTKADEAVRGAPRRSLEERRLCSRELARRSIVLLSNTPHTHPVLPLSLGSGAVLAVIGPNAASTAGQGGGSAQVNPERTVSVLEALRSRYEPLGVEVAHEIGCVTWENTPALELPARLEYRHDHEGSVLHAETTPRYPLMWLGDPVPGVDGLEAGAFSVRATTTYTAEHDGPHQFTIAQVGAARLFVDGELVVEGSQGSSRRFFGFGSEDATGEVELEAGRSYEIVTELEVARGVPLAGLFVGVVPPLPAADELIARAVALAARADAVVCVVGTTAEWETEGHDRPTMDLPGRQDELIAAISAVNRRTVVLVNAGSPVTMGWAELPAAVAQIWFGGEHAGSAVADVISGDAEPGGRLPHTIPVRLEHTPAFAFYPGAAGHAPYGEGLLVGYRHYATRHIEPRYWFGHGLGYTTFEIASPALAEPPGGETVVTAEVRNVGGRSGTEIVQAYLEAPHDAPETEPRIQYVGSGRVTLGPGEESTVSITLPKDRFDRCAPGNYRVLVGRSADPAGLRPAGDVTVTA